MRRRFGSYHEHLLRDYFGPLAALVAGCSPDGVTLQNAQRGASGKGHSWTVHARPWSDSDGHGDEWCAWAGVDRALRALPPDQRAALALAYSYEHTSADAYARDPLYQPTPGDTTRAAPPRALAALAKAAPAERAAIESLTNAARAAFAEAYQ